MYPILYSFGNSNHLTIVTSRKFTFSDTNVPFLQSTYFFFLTLSTVYSPMSLLPLNTPSFTFSSSPKGDLPTIIQSGNTGKSFSTHTSDLLLNLHGTLLKVQTKSLPLSCISKYIGPPDLTVLILIESSSNFSSLRDNLTKHIDGNFLITSDFFLHSNFSPFSK